MFFIYAIFAILFLVLLITINNSLLRFTLFLITGRRFKESQLAFTSLLIGICDIALVFSIYVVFRKCFPEDLLSFTMNTIFKAYSMGAIIKKVCVPILVILGIYIVVCSAIVLTVNIPYAKIFKFKKNDDEDDINDEIPLEQDNNPEDDLVTKPLDKPKNKEKKVSIFDSILCVLFITIAILLCFGIFLLVGYIVGNDYSAGVSGASTLE